VTSKIILLFRCVSIYVGLFLLLYLNYEKNTHSMIFIGFMLTLLVITLKDSSSDK